MNNFIKQSYNYVKGRDVSKYSVILIIISLIANIVYAEEFNSLTDVEPLGFDSLNVRLYW